MRLVKVELSCGFKEIDGCTEVGPADEGTIARHVLQLDDGKPREVHVCAHHEKYLNDILVPLMKDGNPVERSTTQLRRTRRNRTQTSTPSAATG